MKFVLQILLFILTCFASSATISAPKFVVPTNTTIFQKTEKIIQLEKAKIGISNFARSSIEEPQQQKTNFHQNTFSLSSYLKGENSCALNFQKTSSPCQVLVAQFSKKESLSELENRARAVLEVFVSTAGNSLFGRNIINGINGFSDNVASILSQRGLSLNDFKLLQQKRYDLMTVAQKAHIDAIRNSIPMPDAETLLLKVIPKSQISKYTSGEYTQIGGFVSTAKDAKHLNSYEDVYQGMRLDYPGTQFNLSDGSFGVIRYKTANPNLSVPKLPEVTGDLPYTGNSFTGGNNGRLGAPEWKSPYNTPTEGSELWEVFSDGTEVLKAKFSTAQNKFIPVP